MDNKTQNIDLMSRFSCVVHSILKQWRILLLVACLFGSLVDVVRSLTYKPLYRASSVVALVNGDGKGLSSDDAIKAETSIQYLMDSVYLKEKVNATLKQDSFDGSVLFSLTANTNISTIYVQASSQKNAFFELKELINEYQKASKLSSFGYQLTSVEDITFTNMPINTNNHLQNYQKGFFMSLFVGIFILGFYSFIKDNIKTASDINDKLDVRLFAKVPKEIKKDQKWNFFKNKKTPILVSQFKTSFSYVEALNKLTSKLEESANKHNYQTILCTSSIENEGKSSIAVNIAISLAKNKKKVLLIDADLRKPSLNKIFERKVNFPLIDVLMNKNKWKESIVSLEKEHLDVIFSRVCHQSQEILSNSNLKQILNEMKKEYDFIIVDSAPSRYLVDTSIIAQMCDATLLVVKQNDATCKTINDTIYHLVNSSCNVIGAVYNGSVFNPMKSKAMYGYRYGYYRYHRERRSS